MRLLPALLLAALVVIGCSSKRIPGTDIADNADTRAVVATIDAYRRAAERRDVDAVLALVSPKYFDAAGTPDPTDDIDYEALRKRLTEDYARLTAMRLEIAVKRIDVEDGKASAYVFYDEHFRIRTRAGEIAKQASDSGRMTFAREGKGWKFLSGL